MLGAETRPRACGRRGDGVTEPPPKGGRGGAGTINQSLGPPTKPFWGQRWSNLFCFTESPTNDISGPPRRAESEK